MAEKDAPQSSFAPESFELNQVGAPASETLREVHDSLSLQDETITQISGQALREEATLVLSEKEIRQTLKVIGEAVPYNYSIINGEGIAAEGRYNQVQKNIVNAKTIALGDLHGSYQKLLETLVVTGLASMPAEAARQYVKLSQKLEELVAKNPSLTEQPLKTEPKPLFAKILSRIYRDEDVIPLTPLEKARQLQEDIIATIKTMSWIGKKDQKLILIGDIIADRGISDRITLELLSHLTKQNPERMIRLASNHDQSGIHYLLNGQTTMNHQESQTRAFQIANKDEYDSLGELYLEHLSQLKLMHFDPETKTLYAHAPITKKNICDLIDNLKAEDLLDMNYSYHDISSNNLSEFIDTANFFYKESVMFPFENQLSFIDDLAEKTLNDDRGGFLWSRSSHPLIENLPLYEKGANALVHGHDSSTIQKSPYSLDSIDRDTRYSIASLDSDVRKVPGYPGKNNCRLFIS